MIHSYLAVEPSFLIDDFIDTYREISGRSTYPYFNPRAVHDANLFYNFRLKHILIDINEGENANLFEFMRKSVTLYG